ncbi:hypothetical protein CDL15_Pgr024641 [Punica granatum]|uniref:Uncharacterized protein n=1 Tax=Punica granatum TaxID=22663 RepID=A0A218VRU4_PUNGR|nr:hypothetical protein CDL15_Pgr024641 [Punica granatum]
MGAREDVRRADRHVGVRVVRGAQACEAAGALGAQACEAAGARGGARSCSSALGTRRRAW